MSTSKSKEIKAIDIKSYLIGKYIQDQNFKKLFLKNPKETIEKAFETKLPNSLEIKILEDEDHLIHVILPLEADIQEERKISDEDINILAKKSDLQVNIPILKLFLILKSFKHPNFKKVLLADPKDTIEKELKIQIPDQTEIKVLEDTKNLIYVALPSEQIIKAIKEKLSELTDEDLKQIIGGWGDDAFSKFMYGLLGTPLVIGKSIQAIWDPDARVWVDNFGKGKYM